MTRREKLILVIVNRLPKSIVYWTVIRAAGNRPDGTPTDYPAERPLLTILKDWQSA